MVVRTLDLDEFGTTAWSGVKDQVYGLFGTSVHSVLSVSDDDLGESIGLGGGALARSG